MESWKVPLKTQFKPTSYGFYEVQKLRAITNSRFEELEISMHKP
jgi:hypothetical protein